MYNTPKHTFGFGPFPSMQDKGEVYGKDLTEGYYTSRFGFTIVVRDGEVFKIRLNGELLPIHPDAYSIFKRRETLPCINSCPVQDG